jgi:hypothetical protein
MVVLQSVREELVHLGDTGSNAQVDGSVTNVDDESTNDLGVNLGEGVLGVLSLGCWGETYLVGDLELLALADVGGLGDSSLQSVEGSLVESLDNYVSPLSLLHYILLRHIIPK